MEELIKKVSASANITPVQAKTAIETVSASLKEKLPEVMRDQIDNLINGGTLSDGVRKKMNEMGDKVEEVAQEVAGNIKTKFNEIFNNDKK